MSDVYRTATVRERIPLGPLAYFITFRTYGTWLPGDERGWIHRTQNLPHTPYLEPRRDIRNASVSRLRQDAVVLDDEGRMVAGRTIREVCAYKGWALYALNVLPTHMHLVVSLDVSPERALNAFKSWATKRLVEAGVLPSGTQCWSRHGSMRYLWDHASVEAACTYVVEAQGDDNPGQRVAVESASSRSRYGDGAPGGQAGRASGTPIDEATILSEVCCSRGT